MLTRGFTTAGDCGGADGALTEATSEWLNPGITTVRDELRKDADSIKIMAGSGISSRLNNLTHAQFLPEELFAIFRIGASFDTYVTALAYSSRAIRHAVDHGCLGIEYGNFLDAETARYIAEMGIYLTPTLVTYNTLVLPPFDQYINAGSCEARLSVQRG